MPSLANSNPPPQETLANSVRIVQADLEDPRHRAAVLEMTRSYAMDPMGNDSDLPDHVQNELIPRLRAHPTTLIFLDFDEHTPIGLATSFIGFSTFAARPLINIHDLHVVKSYRGKGLGRMLLEAVEEKARELGCCKLTLEVLENNHPAILLYRNFGFVEGAYQPEAGKVLFRVKSLF